MRAGQDFSKYLGKRVKVVFEDKERVTSVPCILTSIDERFIFFTDDNGSEQFIPIFRVIRVELLHESTK